MLCISVDGNYCITCGSDKSVILWNPHRQVQLKKYSGHGYEVLDARASCDSSQLCSCGMDKSVIGWDVASGKTLRKYRGHAGKCRSCNTIVFRKHSERSVMATLIL